MHSKIDKIEILIGNERNESIEKLFESLLLKNKKAKINPKNNDSKCFQYALTVALNHEQIKKDPQRITKIKPFIDQCNWKEIDFPSHNKD